MSAMQQHAMLSSVADHQERTESISVFRFLNPWDGIIFGARQSAKNPFVADHQECAESIPVLRFLAPKDGSIFGAHQPVMISFVAERAVTAALFSDGAMVMHTQVCVSVAIN